ncbi:MAG TPA: rhodanese-like domain-containing protein [Ktedonobacteraceae bacterium]|jgi:rhodanese-related sulfurtransferase
MMAYNEIDQQPPYKTIGTEEAHRMVEAGAHVIDVRRPEEWNRGHIAQADLIPVEAGIYDFGKTLKDMNLPAEEDVIFVCASGQRSALASEIALLTGLNKVYNLANGMYGWIQRGYPVEQ